MPKHGDLSKLPWRKSKHSADAEGECVEVTPIDCSAETDTEADPAQ